VKRKQTIINGNDILKQGALIMGRKQKSYKITYRNIWYQHYAASYKQPEVRITINQPESPIP